MKAALGYLGEVQLFQFMWHRGTRMHITCMLHRWLTQARKESNNPIASATDIATFSLESPARLIERCCVFFVGLGLLDGVARRDISQPCCST